MARRKTFAFQVVVDIILFRPILPILGFTVAYREDRLLQQLRALIGQIRVYSGHGRRIIEVLDQEKVLMLRCEGGERIIQDNPFVEAARRVPHCHTLPFVDERQRLNPVIRRWLEQTRRKYRFFSRMPIPGGKGKLNHTSRK